MPIMQLSKVKYFPQCLNSCASPQSEKQSIPIISLKLRSMSSYKFRTMVYRKRRSLQYYISSFFTYAYQIWMRELWFFFLSFADLRKASISSFQSTMLWLISLAFVQSDQQHLYSTLLKWFGIGPMPIFCNYFFNFQFKMPINFILSVILLRLIILWEDIFQNLLIHTSVFDLILLFQFQKMEALQNQVNLLKTYISTLQKENEARNLQKNTLFNQIDRLSAENDRLNALLLSKSTIKPNNSLNSDKEELIKIKNLNNSLTVQVSELKRQNLSYKAEIDNLKTQKRSSEVIITSNSEAENLKVTVTRLTANVRQKQAEILRLTQQKQNLLKDLQLAQQSLSRSSTTVTTETVLLKNQIATYKSRISQLQVIEQNFKSISSRLSELENQNRRLQGDFRKKQADCRQFESQVKRLEVQNRQLRANTRSPTELSSLLSSKLSLEATIRQLNSKLQWSQTNIKSLQGEKSVAERRVKELQKELLEVKGRLTQYKFSEESYKNVQANVMIRQKQMQALQQMIVSLKQNKKYLEKTLKQKQEVVTSLQSQIYTFRSSNYENQRQKNELNDLRMIKSDYERQIANLSHSNQDILAENNRLQLQIKSLNISLIEAREERQRLIRKMHQTQPEIKVKYVQREYTSSNNNEQDLRQLVARLQMEVQEMKNSTTSKIYHHYQSQDSNFVNQRSSMMIRDKSPVKANHSKLISQKDKQIVHRSKWQNLQRKINALRSENQILKRSLFQ